MPSGIENNVGYFTALKVGDIYGNNYVTIDKDGVQAFHGTSHLDDESSTADVFKSIRVAYDTSNKLDITCSSVGAGVIAMTGSSDSLTLQTGDGDIILTAGGNVVLTPASGKGILLNGRLSTSSLAGAAINIDGTTSQYGEGVELRYNISDWADTYTLTEGSAILARMETNEANASGSIYGGQLWGVTNNVNLEYLWGGFAYAYIKGTSAKALTGVYGFQPEISFDAGSGTNTITDAAVVRAKVTGGVMSDYTVLDGFRLTLGDMDGQSRTYGNGLLLEDDTAMAGTCALTTGINITISCGSFLNINNVGTTSTIGVEFIDAYLGKVIETGTYSNSADKGVVVTSTNWRPVSFLFDDSGDAIGGNVDISPTLSRMMYTVNQQTAECRIATLRGHMMMANGIAIGGDTSEHYASQGLIECVGTLTVDAGSFAAGVCGMIWADGNTTNNGHLAGVMAKLYQTAGTTGENSSAFLATKWWNSADNWVYGLNVESNTADTGIYIGTCAGANIHFVGGADGSAEGDFWYDVASHTFKYRDNAGVKTITSA